ncbi:glyoxalase [Veronia nyctiphanis]|uniref:Glyoxalase n=1 Tax=Veronia nyctiphanis TaxID=1278244 RepID=A0A4Q0YQG6_9GAMM|nr:VOC family protein [Veronia nyctiphanis]RXJ73360.1 glyoxalase [Veronia nyctiphanis]
MMRLEHINLVVRDIPETLHFYQAAFPTWKVRSHGTGEWSGKKRNWLHFGDDYHYLAFSDNGVGENRDLAGHQTGLAHFAYTTDEIQSVIDRLEAAGYPALKSGPDNPFRRNVYFIDPNGFEVEFVQYFSDKPEERNNELS